MDFWYVKIVLVLHSILNDVKYYGFTESSFETGSTDLYFKEKQTTPIL